MRSKAMEKKRMKKQGTEPMYKEEYKYGKHANKLSMMDEYNQFIAASSFIQQKPFK